MNQVEFDFILFGERRSLEQATKVIITDDTGFTPFIRVLRAEASSGNSRTKKVIASYSKYLLTCSLYHTFRLIYFDQI